MGHAIQQSRGHASSGQHQAMRSIRLGLEAKTYSGDLVHSVQLEQSGSNRLPQMLDVLLIRRKE
jgi:hypothetical protein